MKINLSEKVFTPNEIKFVLAQLKTACSKGFIKERSENNIYLMASYSGVEEKGITPKWNIKIYELNKKTKKHSIVCVDNHILDQLLAKNYDAFIPPDLDVLRIDDAGWGFPLLGVMVGVSDERDVKSEMVPVEYFRDDSHNHFKSKKYLKIYADLALELMGQFGASPATHRIEICTGYVNQPLREKIRKLGFDVRVVEIKGLLQDKLENIYKEYVYEKLGVDIYYDPKDMKKSDIPKMYYKCLNFGLKNCPELIKTGWESLNGILK
ncbi:hypothetical protein H8E88_25905 [candidate division KSB1 bacterium]|nr:hypothetical protein [candidate division KSB1 bacterium]